ncbi:sensor histidine kinase [Sulfitobacter profundi]|uniref:histidine kinase n=1 Tax=Sulfitobacter profundi TaxID=2679961 RepID=A0ABW1YTU8_9RHOB
MTIKVPDEQLEVFGDKNLLTQLLSNLVENAIRHCPVGSKVLVLAETTPVGPTLRVTDDGPGIECENRERIFRRFFRGEKSRNSPGNGLGLALAKAICDLHGAEITVSENDPGTTFEINFLR